MRVTGRREKGSETREKGRLGGETEIWRGDKESWVKMRCGRKEEREERRKEGRKG